MSDVDHALEVMARVKMLVPNKANLRVGYGEILADEVIRLRAELAALRAALQPFADRVHADGVDAPYPEDVWKPLLLAAHEVLRFSA